MSRTRTILLALLALLCVGAVTSAAALASEGEIVNSSGNAVVKNKIEGTSGTTLLETAKGTKLTCKSETLHGVITSKTGGEGTTLFKECTSGGLSCKGGKDASGEAPAGSIFELGAIVIRKNVGRTEDLLQTIGFKPGTKEVGEIEVVCSGLKIKLKGNALSQPIVLKKLSKTYTVGAKQKKGVQEPNEYETEAKVKVKANGEASIEGGAFEDCAGEGTETVTFEEEVQFL